MNENKTLYPNRKKQLEADKAKLVDQIQKGQQSLDIIQQELRKLVEEHNRIQAKLELLDEIETKGDDKM